MPRSQSLGAVREVQLPAARIRYRERGDGPPVVFVHGLLVNADLWRNVVPPLAAAGVRCIAPDWPLGAHEVPVPDADLSPPGVATLVAAFLDVLDLHEVTVVANDTGGAITQILMAERRRPNQLMLTDVGTTGGAGSPTVAGAGPAGIVPQSTPAPGPREGDGDAAVWWVTDRSISSMTGLRIAAPDGSTLATAGLRSA